MTYTIVFKSGKVKRLLNIDAVQVTPDFIIFTTKDKKKTYTYFNENIASVVFYP